MCCGVLCVVAHLIHLEQLGWQLIAHILLQVLNINVLDTQQQGQADDASSRSKGQLTAMRNDSTNVLERRQQGQAASASSMSEHQVTIRDTPTSNLAADVVAH